MNPQKLALLLNSERRIVLDQERLTEKSLIHRHSIIEKLAKQCKTLVKCPDSIVGIRIMVHGMQIYDRLFMVSEPLPGCQLRIHAIGLLCNMLFNPAYQQKVDFDSGVIFEMASIWSALHFDLFSPSFIDYLLLGGQGADPNERCLLLPSLTLVKELLLNPNFVQLPPSIQSLQVSPINFHSDIHSMMSGRDPSPFESDPTPFWEIDRSRFVIASEKFVSQENIYLTTKENTSDYYVCKALELFLKMDEIGESPNPAITYLDLSASAIVEISIHRWLKHCFNTVRIERVTYKKGMLYLFTPFVGHHLLNYYSQYDYRVDSSNAKFKSIFKQALISLDEIHQRGVVHGDIKPHNLMVYESMNGEVTLRLIDFGLSFFGTATNKVQRYTQIYTPPEANPELNESMLPIGRIIDYKSDIWALAISFMVILRHDLWYGEDRPTPNIVEIPGAYRTMFYYVRRKVDTFLVEQNDLNLRSLLRGMTEENSLLRFDAQRCLNDPYFLN